MKMEKDNMFKILARVDELSKELGMSILEDHGKMTKITFMIDLDILSNSEAERLASFDDENFIHDVVGIQRNINRLSHELENFFVPRCADHNHIF